jgi:hypothetical protein
MTTLCDLYQSRAEVWSHTLLLTFARSLPPGTPDQDTPLNRRYLRIGCYRHDAGMGWGCYWDSGSELDFSNHHLLVEVDLLTGEVTLARLSATDYPEKAEALRKLGHLLEATDPIQDQVLITTR